MEIIVEPYYKIIKYCFQNLYSEKYLYHYTNLSSLLSIIKTKELWLSERSCMNDINDEKFVSDFCHKIAKNKINDNPWKYIETTHQYVFSTSKEKDSIHQWSYYGDGDGVCIEFNRKALIDLFGKFFEWTGYYYGSVLYTKEFEIDSTEKQIIEHIYNEYLETKNTDKNDEQSFQYEIVSEYLYSLVKQFGHHCEQEYRFVITEDSINFKINELQSVKNKKLIKCLNPSFRPMKSLIVPYIRIPFKPEKLITSIIIGPNNHEDIAERNLKFYLESQSLSNINVTRSKMSTR